MKKIAPLLLAILLKVNGYGQIKFEKGYFIDNENQRVDCLIKNSDWENNPDYFLFKLHENEEPQKATIETVKEFEISGAAKFIRFTVDIDRSSEEIRKLSTVRAPEFKTETLFLKSVVEGKASLFAYTDVNLKRFFFTTDSVPITQLVFKSFLYGQTIWQNSTFRQQLLDHLHCDESLKRRIENLHYSNADLKKVFISYNACAGKEQIATQPKVKRDVFNLWIRPRFTSSTLSAKTSNSNFQFDTKTNFSIGIEAEIILPFNKNKWAIIIEPTYQSYSAAIISEPIRVDYKAIEIPIGARHYFFLNNNSKLSLSAAFQFNFSNNSTLVHYSNVVLDLKPDPNLAFECGYTFKNKLSVGYRYQTPRQMLGEYPLWTSDFSSMAIIVGYAIF